MQKIGMVLAMLLCAVLVQAGTYAYLVFTNTEGTKTALSVTDMTMKVNGTQLDVTNTAGTVNFALTDLAAMQFSEDGETLPAGIVNVLNADAPVTVYSISGASLGTFDNLVQAAQQLGTGAYVISNGSISQTIVIK